MRLKFQSKTESESETNSRRPVLVDSPAVLENVLRVLESALCQGKEKPEVYLP
jgi:hypothetical protein